MSKEVEFVGGPHDGLRLRSGLGSVFLYTDGRRCFRAPARGRALYRAAPRFSMRFVFVGFEFGLCKCGVFRRRHRGDCQVCGAAGFVG